MAKMIWQFPSNEVGEIEGPNNAGISHFADQRDTNLVRESIQNSLDAKAGIEPVRVEFSLTDLPATAFEAGRLRDILGYSVDSPHNDENGSEQFDRARWLLNDNRQIRTICITDSNTTGAQDVPRPGGTPSKWEALTKGSGSPAKDQKDAAGSFGLGKHSAFAVTDLRTVLYSTAWRDENRLNQRFIGKSILVSHRDGDGKPRRGTGYLSAGSYAPLKDSDVPHTFALREPGTAIFIPGFSKQRADNLLLDGMKTAIDNYFHAIVMGNLIVKVGNAEVNSDTIGKEFSGAFSRTANFIRVSKMAPVAQERFTGIGTVKLRISVHDDLRSKAREIALVRDSGMMITAERRDMDIGLASIPQIWRGFTAIIECISEPGESSYIRDSESPKHDKLSVDYIEDTDRRKDASNALREMGQWVRERIEKEAGLETPDSDDYVDELAKYFPIYDEDGKPGNADKPGHVDISAPRQSRNTGGGAGLLAGEHGARRGGQRRPRTSGGSGGSGGRGGGSGQTGANQSPPTSVSSERYQGTTGQKRNSLGYRCL